MHMHQCLGRIYVCLCVTKWRSGLQRGLMSVCTYHHAHPLRPYLVPSILALVWYDSWWTAETFDGPERAQTALSAGMAA